MTTTSTSNPNELSQYLPSMPNRVNHRPCAIPVSAHQFIHDMEENHKKIQILNVFNSFLFYFVVHMHGYVLLTICITIQPVCNNLAAGCY